MLRNLIKYLISVTTLIPVVNATVLPVDTELNVRLTNEVSSAQKSGQPVEAVLVVPVFLNGAPVLDSGTVLTGNTADVQPYKAKTETDPEQPATIRLQFTKIRGNSGKPISLYCVLTSVDNAREKVDSSGLITGIEESQTFGSEMDRGIAKLQEHYGQFAQILGQVKSAVVKQVDPSIDFKPGVALTLKLTRSLDISTPASKPAVVAIEPTNLLAQMVNSQPLRTEALKPPDPSDMTNIMFIGTLEQVSQAFQKAGWFPADALSSASKMETARAIIEDRGYNEAPMSILTLDGRPPDLALQRQTDTFAMRHHIRIWQRPQTFDGKPVCVAAATHDISITFSQQAKDFTHGIDPHIDAERSKVVYDMLFTGLVKGVALVDRSNLPVNPSNATGDKLITDGKMAVVEF